MQNKNIVIGIGNLLFLDDGVGVIAVKYLSENFTFTPKLELLDGGTLGFNLAEYFLDYDNVFIVDTISIDDEPGSLYKVPAHELLQGENHKKTAHEVEVLQMLQACELYDKKADITIFGVVPSDISTVKIGLSEALVEKFDVLIDTLIQSIQELDIKVQRRNNVTLQEIIRNIE